MKSMFPISKLLILPFAGMLLNPFPQPGLGQEPPPDELRLPASFPWKARQPTASEDELRKLLIARYNSALKELEVRFMQFLAGRGSLDFMLSVTRRLTECELELCDKPADQIAVRQKLIEITKDVEKINQQRWESGRAGLEDVEFSRYWRLDAEIQLLRAKRKMAEAK